MSDDQDRNRRNAAQAAAGSDDELPEVTAPEAEAAGAADTEAANGAAAEAEAADAAPADAEARAKARAAGMPLLLVALGIIFVAITLVSRLLAPLQPECVNTVIETVPSPDGVWNAILFERSCGASTGFSSQVSLLLAGHELPDLAGNALVATDGNTAVGTAWGGPEVTVVWTDSRHVAITYDPSARIASRRDSVGEVGVSFVEAPAAPQGP